MESTAIFDCKNRNIAKINILCKSDEVISKILQKFINKVSTNGPPMTLEEFDFYYNGEKFDKNSTIIKLKDNDDLKEIEFTFNVKSKITKCPECDCNDAVLYIKNYRLNFYGCIYDHEISKIFDRYESTQNIEYDKIICKNNKCGKTQNDELLNFKKCLSCQKLTGNTTYYCQKCSLEHPKSHKMIDYDEKYYYCEHHFKLYNSYCSICKLNLCPDCKADTCKKGNNHNIIKYEEKIPDIKNIKSKLDEIKEKIFDLKIIVDQIKNNMDGAVKIIEKYYDMAQDIIGKYELFNIKNKNYQILKTMNLLDETNKDIMKDLDNIIAPNKNLKEKSCILIDIYESDRGDYNKGMKNNNSFACGKEEIIYSQASYNYEKSNNIDDNNKKLIGNNFKFKKTNNFNKTKNNFNK